MTCAAQARNVPRLQPAFPAACSAAGATGLPGGGGRGVRRFGWKTLRGVLSEEGRVPCRSAAPLRKTLITRHCLRQGQIAELERDGHFARLEGQFPEELGGVAGAVLFVGVVVARELEGVGGLLVAAAATPAALLVGAA